jgi:hypothetical protein
MDYTITIPKTVSLNTFYAGGHWTKRTGIKREVYGHIQQAMQTHKRPDQPIERYNLTLSHNTRFDTDNTIVGIKFFSDWLRKNGWTKEDSKKYLREINLRVDEQLPNDVFQLTLHKLD